MVEAFNFLAASVHQETGKGSHRDDATSHLFNSDLLGNDDDMDEEDAEPTAASVASSSSRITREQLSAALNSALGKYNYNRSYQLHICITNVYL